MIGPLFLISREWNWALEHRHLLGWISGWTFAVASISDFIDGYIARKQNIQTVFGSFLDPIADKFLVISSLIILQDLERIPVLVVIILSLKRDLYDVFTSFSF